MSGGVDSSVAAALLAEAGHEVIGITMQVHPDDEEAGAPRRFGGCCGVEDVVDAGRVARTLGIPHYVANFRDLFAREVIEDFCREYLAGRTPNPCIRCNRYLKFDALLERARQLEADCVATGHYARIDYDTDVGRYRLLQGIDAGKDQSYVLYGMTQPQLAHSLFPVGELTKQEVREAAKRLDLPVAEKPESQEICFVADDDYARFVTNHTGRQPTPGPILDTAGRVVGRHHGIAAYTIGQRKGLGAANGRPRYVIAIDPTAGSLTVGDKADVYSDELTAAGLNWIAFDQLETPLPVKAKIRYRHEPAEATVTPLEGGEVRVTFQEPQAAIAPGQAVVFYDGASVIGGGSIARVAQRVVVAGGLGV
jgi:tRNA-specific 2-thiouridylase